MSTRNTERTEIHRSTSVVFGERIGLAPVTNRADNLFQGKVVLGGMIVGAILCLVFHWPNIFLFTLHHEPSPVEMAWWNALDGAVLGMIASSTVSGLWLMVAHLRRS